jgi:hypothetical protein
MELQSEPCSFFCKGTECGGTSGPRCQVDGESLEIRLQTIPSVQFQLIMILSAHSIYKSSTLAA